MKVYIGKYPKWHGPYEIAAKICFWHKHDMHSEQETYVERFGEFLSNIKPLVSVLEWMRGSRKIQVRIHDYDVWNMDQTLSMLIHPMLIKLRETKHSSSPVDNEDVPVHLQRLDSLGEHEIDEMYHARWEWVLDEMIWAFGTSAMDDDGEASFFTGKADWEFELDDDGNQCMVKGKKDTLKVDKEGLDAYHARIANGTRLFGRYYQSLWD